MYSVVSKSCSARYQQNDVTGGIALGPCSASNGNSKPLKSIQRFAWCCSVWSTTCF